MRARRQRAHRYVTAALTAPNPADVTWLAAAAAPGDEDHARWELRYARMALAVFVAERDALDDRTGSDITAAMHESLRGDEGIAAEMLPLAERQFADRLQGYREAFFSRGGAVGTSDNLGRVLLAFASDGARSAGTPLPRAKELLAGYALEVNEALRAAYGTAALPEHLAPSEVVSKG